MSCLNRWLRERRKSRGLTMRELGERLGVAHSYVQKVESGERRLDVVEYIWYCRALDAEPGEGLGLVLKCAENMPEWGKEWNSAPAGDAWDGN
ncbi:helix-turn-helix domain-containing protein [Thauera sp. SDU_THAU2]|uniref:helix-turn-helix domain-containing protein n=2 Tax=unclassified Thauera TaxID=2609274 RepID=UPI0031203F2A